MTFQSLAVATPITWYLSGVHFDDGGTASGSFIFDQDTATYSAINITTTLGNPFVGAHYLAPLTAGSGPAFLEALTAASGDFTGTPMLQLWYSTGLTNAGGTVVLSAPNSGEFQCVDSGCINVSPHCCPVKS
jgi:hypothetical protein